MANRGPICGTSAREPAELVRDSLVPPLPQFIGNVVYRNVLGLTYNLPFAAAYAMVPLAVMGIYLILARRAGAFEAL